MSAVVNTDRDGGGCLEAHVCLLSAIVFLGALAGLGVFTGQYLDKSI